MDGPSFVQIVEQELKKQKKSKAEFYEGSGISSATFSQWRKGIYTPSSTNIKRIEKFLGIHFELSKKEKPAPDSSGTDFNPTIQDWEDALNKMDREQLKAVIDAAMKKFMEADGKE